MASRPYSETFLRLYGMTGWSTWSCPGNFRAVVRNITVVDGIGVSGHAQVDTKGVMLALVIFPASFRQVSLDTRAVLYPGDNLNVFMAVVGIHVTVSGFLFEDPTQAQRAPGGFVAEPGLGGAPVIPEYEPPPSPRGTLAGA